MTIEAPTISIVIPTRNEEANADRMAAAIIAEMEKIGETFDIIFIDNESSDRTVEIIKDLCSKDARIRLIVNARNFGQMRSPTHGIFSARGKAVISLCADFQDPPSMIPELISHWKRGYKIVLGQRESEKSGPILTAIRKLSYWFAARFGDYPVLRNVTGFGLYDGEVVRAIEKLNEPEPFFRGMLVETGAPLLTLPYPRLARAGGRSNNNFFALLDFMLSSVSAASKKVVRVPTYLGGIAMMAAVICLPIALIAALLGGKVMPWIWLSLFELHFGLLFVFLGVLGDQVRLISERTRHTPLVMERERVNFPEGY